MNPFLKYYEQELTYIRKMASIFAEKHPKVASRLLLEPDKCEDPYTERLLESAAFINARLHQKIDDDLPEITEPLLQILFPHFIHPTPSMTIARFIPDMTTVPPTGYNVSKGTLLYSTPVKGVTCRFTTACQMILWPLVVKSVHVQEPKKTIPLVRHAIIIELEPCHNLKLDQVTCKNIRFYINGPLNNALRLYELLMNHTKLVEYRAGSKGAVGNITRPGLQGIQPAGFSSDEAILPSTMQETFEDKVLYEYFSFPEKFLFFDVTGLDKIDGRDKNMLQIWIYLDALVDIPLSPDTFSMHCVPLINLFPAIIDSVPVKQNETVYNVPTNSIGADTAVHSIQTVSGSIPGSDDWEYSPLYSIGYHGRKAVYYQMGRNRHAVHEGLGSDVTLSFFTLDMEPSVPEAEKIIIHALCFNKGASSGLSHGKPDGDFSVAKQAIPLKRIECLLKPTKPHWPSVDEKNQWEYLSLLYHCSLIFKKNDAGSFREMLLLYEDNRSPVARQMVNGIIGIHFEHTTARLDQYFQRGIRVTLQFDENSLEGVNVYLFASVLDRHLARYVSANSFSQLVVEMMPAGRLLRKFPPRKGARPIL